jgi:7-cyano-7-deazaguanine synthase
MSNGRALVLCSGGLDSSCLLAYLQAERSMKVYPLFVARGQRALECEKAAFTAVVEHLGLSENSLQATYDISSIPQRDGSMNGGQAGFVAHPERNLVLASIGYAYAAALNSPTVYMACNADDGGADISDSTPSFFDGVTGVLHMLKPRGKVELPFAQWTKAQIVTWACRRTNLGPRFLGLTRSCWQDTPKHCGKCNACRIRREAFQTARVDDPTAYMD